VRTVSSTLFAFPTNTPEPPINDVADVFAVEGKGGGSSVIGLDDGDRSEMLRFGAEAVEEFAGVRY
jgi:hypothetical protein